MSRFPSLPLYTDAFLADTMHLNAHETGAYLMLLMVAWRSPDCRLPDDDKKLAKWARCDPRTWAKTKAAVMEFWDLAEGYWTQKRLVSELDKVSKRAEAARENGAQGGRPKSLKNLEAANRVGYARVTQKKPPISISISTEEERERDTPSLQRTPTQGTFIDPGWRPQGDDREMAIETLGLERAKLEHAKFMDFWKAKSGSNGRKRDWSATWRNWVRRAVETHQPSKGDPDAKSATAAAKRHLAQSRILDDLERRARPVLQIVGPGGGDDADGVLPEGRRRGSGHLLGECG